MNCYDQAIQTIKTIAKWQNDKHALLNLARCYETMGEYDRAIAMHQHFTGLRNDKQVLISLARCYQTMKCYDDALNTFHMIRNWANDKSTLLGIARCYQAMGLYDDAVKSYQSFTHWQQDNQILISLAQCFEEMRQYDKALDTYQSICGWKNNKVVLLSLARCYQYMGQYDQAVKSYHVFTSWQQDKLFLISLARCYEEMGNDDNAVGTYHLIYSWENDKETLLSLARCYQAMEHYDESIKTYQLFTHWKQDKEVLISLGRCYQAMGNYDLALSTLSMIGNWKNDKKALLGLAHCYEDMGQFDQALTTFRMIHNWENDEIVLLSLSRCYESSNSDATVAENAYLKTLEKFHQSQNTHYFFCRFVVKNDHINAENILISTLQQWPYMGNLYLLKAQYYNKQGDLVAELDVLKKAAKLFPHFSDIYVAIIKYYLLAGDFTEAMLIKEYCFSNFKDHNILFRRIDNLFRAKIFIQIWQGEYCDDFKENVQLILPSPIKSIFELLESIPGDSYLVGSTVLSLLSNNAYGENRDVDFIIATSDISTVGSELKHKGFFLCPYNSKLYTMKKNLFSIDCYVVLSTSTSLFFPDINALSRDFTIACLYCDKQGNLFDPTGDGVRDFKHKRLRTVGDSVVRLQEDPVRLLRAIKYIYFGFKPLPSLEDAMKNWEPSASTMSLSHIKAVARKQLLSFDKLQYTQLLLKYDLLEKLFSVIPKENLYLTLSQLDCTLLKLETNYSPGFFPTKKMIQCDTDIDNLEHINENETLSPKNCRESI